MANLVEITKTETIKMRLGAVQTNNRADLEGVLFIKGLNLVTGELEQFATTEDRADMFAHRLLIDNKNIGKEYDITVRVVPKAENGIIPAYKTRKALTIDGVDYPAGSLVPYRNLDGFKVIELCSTPYVQSPKDIFFDMTEEEYDPKNPEHRALYLEIRKTM